MTALAKLSAPLECVRTRDLPWEPIGTHGLTRKILGHDEASGHTTFLLNIPEGWHGGGVAHYHECFEEVFMLEGSVTLDGSHYWRAGDYFYRPAHIVHGIAESSEEGAKALVRCDAKMQLMLVHEPDSREEYPLPEFSDPRGHIFSVPTAEAQASTDAAFPEDWQVKLLSHDPETGARTVMAEIPPGWSGDSVAPGASWEAIVLEGALTSTKGEHVAGDYTVGGHETAVFGALASRGGAQLLVWMFGS